MDRNGRSRLNTYQSLALAVLISTLTALAVLFSLRLRNHSVVPESMEEQFASGSPPGDPQAEIGGSAQPAPDAVQPAGVPQHFSEDLIIPGLTHTGPEIAEQDVREGSSPDGV